MPYVGCGVPHLVWVVMRDFRVGDALRDPDGGRCENGWNQGYVSNSNSIGLLNALTLFMGKDCR